MPPIVLASASPRRAQLLRALEIPFTLRPSNAPEPPPLPADAAAPGAYVEALARLKASSIQSEDLVIAADTVVVLDGQILGKPTDEADARAMLAQMRGQAHRVFTGVCLRRGQQMESAHEITRVSFGEFSDEFIAAYVRTGEPMDKSGSYGAQGKGALLVERIEGDYWNVVGLPLALLCRMLRGFGVEVAEFWGK